MSDKYSISKTTIDKAIELLEDFKYDPEFGLDRDDVVECLRLIKAEIRAQSSDILIENEEKITAKVPKVRRVKYL
jgi:hypothetical protein